MDNEIMWINLDKGVPSASIASYGITLNPVAVEIIQGYDAAVVGYHKKRSAIIFAVLRTEDDFVPEGGFKIQDRISAHGYLRINNKDLVRAVSKLAGLDLTSSTRFLVEWDEHQQYLIIDLTKELENDKNKKRKRAVEGSA